MSVEDICGMRKNGASFGEIVKATGVPKTTVFRRVKQNCPDAGTTVATALVPATQYIVAAQERSPHIQPSSSVMPSGRSSQPISTPAFQSVRRATAPIHTPPTYTMSMFSPPSTDTLVYIPYPLVQEGPTPPQRSVIEEVMRDLLRAKFVAPVLKELYQPSVTEQRAEPTETPSTCDRMDNRDVSSPGVDSTAQLCPCQPRSAENTKNEEIPFIALESSSEKVNELEQRNKELEYQLEQRNEHEKFLVDIATMRKTNGEKSAQAQKELVKAIADFSESSLKDMVGLMKSSTEAATQIIKRRDETARSQQDSQLEDLKQMRELNKQLFDLQYPAETSTPPSKPIHSVIDSLAQSSAQMKAGINWKRVGLYAEGIALVGLAVAAAAVESFVARARRAPRMFAKAEPPSVFSACPNVKLRVFGLNTPEFQPGRHFSA